MYITLSNVQQGASTSLNPSLDNRDGALEVALVELLFYPAWANISAELQNNRFKFAGKQIIVPSGYYDVCTLNSQIFEPLKLSLTLNPATGRLSCSGLKTGALLEWGTLGPTLGFTRATAGPGAGLPEPAQTLPRLIVHKELFVHLEGLSSTANRLNALPSTLLRAVPVRSEACNQGRHEIFAVPLYKRLEQGTLGDIRLDVRDAAGSPVPLAYLSCVLHIIVKQ